ncbi:LysR family transcriptional regulator [bacterium]|nr:LysR family transcriptional regulator [bacterium]
MRISVNVQIKDDDGEKFMGRGPYELLRRVDKLGSIRQAAIDMDMSYAKAHKLLKNLEKNLGVQLMEKTIGGADHGGTKLTAEARVVLKLYVEMVREIETFAQGSFAKFMENLTKL